MKGPKYHQLTIFQAIVREGSIRAAARQLEMTPPSVSHALKLLETELGLPLFTRSTRRIELTEAGTQLYENTYRAVNELDYALESVRNLNNHPSGTVSITLPRLAYQHILRPIFAEFCQRYPDVRLEFSVSDESVNIIEKGFDLGIRFGDRIEEGMVAKPLTKTFKDAFFATEEYLAEHGMPQNAAQLQQHKLVSYRYIASNQLAPIYIKQNGQPVLIEMQPALIVNDTDAIVDAALEGVGLGRMVYPVVEAHFTSGRLIPILPELWPDIPGLHLYFVQHSQKALRVRVFIDFLMEKYGNLNGLPKDA